LLNQNYLEKKAAVFVSGPKIRMTYFSQPPFEQVATIIATASLNETELNEYCRSKCLYPAQIEN